MTRHKLTAAMNRVRAMLGDAPDDLPFSRTVQDETPWGTREASEEETPCTAGDLRVVLAHCDAAARLREWVRARIFKGIATPHGEGYNSALREVLDALAQPEAK